MGIVLGANQYGKAETRLVRVDRDGDRHALHDLNVSVALRGDLEGTHLSGDNATVLPTDSLKNTVYAFAKRYGVGQIEESRAALCPALRRLPAEHRRGPISIEEYGWTRLGPHFVRPRGRRDAHGGAHLRRHQAWAIGGLQGLVLLNSTDSEFWGYLKTATRRCRRPATDPRTAVTACWRFGAVPGDWADTNASVRGALIEAFVDTYSRSLQQTLYQMGRRVLEKRPEIVEVRLSLPNKHHLLVDLTPFGLDNPNEVFVAADRPYGLIEGTVLRDDAPAAGLAWW
jgi:urate oxidase